MPEAGFASQFQNLQGPRVTDQTGGRRTCTIARQAYPTREQRRPTTPRGSQADRDKPFLNVVGV